MSDDILISLGMDAGALVSGLQEAQNALAQAGSGMTGIMKNLSDASMTSALVISTAFSNASKKLGESLVDSFKPQEMLASLKSMDTSLQAVAHTMVEVSAQITQAFNKISSGASNTAQNVKSSMSSVASSASNAGNAVSNSGNAAKKKKKTSAATSSDDEESSPLVNDLRYFQRTLQTMGGLHVSPIKLDARNVLDTKELSRFFKDAFGHAINDTVESVRERNLPMFKALGKAMADEIDKVTKGGKSYADQALKVAAKQLRRDDDKFLDLSFASNQRVILDLLTQRHQLLKASTREEKLIAQIMLRQNESRLKENELKAAGVKKLADGSALDTQKLKSADALQKLTLAELRIEKTAQDARAADLNTSLKILQSKEKQNRQDRAGLELVERVAAVEARRKALRDKDDSVKQYASDRAYMSLKAEDVKDQTKEQIAVLAAKVKKAERDIAKAERAYAAAIKLDNDREREISRRDSLYAREASVRREDDKRAAREQPLVPADKRNRQYDVYSGPSFTDAEAAAISKPKDLKKLREANDKFEQHIEEQEEKVIDSAHARIINNLNDDASREVRKIKNRLSGIEKAEGRYEKKAPGKYEVKPEHVIDPAKMAELEATGSPKIAKELKMILSEREAALRIAKEENKEEQSLASLLNKKAGILMGITKLENDSVMLLRNAHSVALEDVSGTKEYASVSRREQYKKMREDIETAAKNGDAAELTRISDILKRERDLHRFRKDTIKELDQLRAVSGSYTQEAYDKDVKYAMEASAEELVLIHQITKESIEANKPLEKAIDLDKERLKTLTAINKAYEKQREMERVAGGPRLVSQTDALDAKNKEAQQTQDAKVLERIRHEMDAERSLLKYRIDMMKQWEQAYKDSQGTLTRISASVHRARMEQIRTANVQGLQQIGDEFQKFRSVLDTQLDMRKVWEKNAEAVANFAKQISALSNTVLGAARGAFSMLSSAMGQTTQYFENLHAVAEELGTDFDHAQRTIAMFQEFGISVSRAQMGLRALAKSYQGAVTKDDAALDKFNQLGITLGDLNRTGGDTVRLFDLIVEKAKKIEDPLKRFSTVSSLAGRSNVSMVRVMTSSPEALAEARKNSNTMSEESAKVGIVLAARWEQLRTTMSVSMAKIMVALKDPIEKIIKFLKDMAEGTVELVKDCAPLISMIVSCITYFGKFAIAIALAAKVLGGIASVVLSVVRALRSFGVITEIITMVRSLAAAFSICAAGGGVFAGVMGALGTVVGATAAPIVALVAALGAAVYAWSWFTSSSKDNMDEFKKNLEEHKEYVEKAKQHAEERKAYGLPPMNVLEKSERAKETAEKIKEADEHIEKASADLAVLTAKKAKGSLSENEEKTRAELIDTIKKLREARAALRKEIAELASTDPPKESEESITSKRQWEDQYKRETVEMQSRIRKKEAITEKDIIGYRESLSQTLESAQMNDKEAPRLKLDAQADSFLSQASAENASTIRRILKKQEDALRRKIREHADFSADYSELSEYTDSVKGVIGDRYLTAGLESSIQAEVDRKASQMKQVILDRKLSALHTTFKNQIAIDLETKLGRDIFLSPHIAEQKRRVMLEDMLVGYRKQQQGVIGEADLTKEERLAKETKLENEINELRRKYLRKEIGLESETIRVIRDMRRALVQEEKAQMEHTLEMNKTATLGNYRKEEMDITNQIIEGKLEEGDAERELHMLGEKKRDAEMLHAKEMDRVRRESYAQQKKYDEDAMDRLVRSVDYFRKVFYDKHSDSATRLMAYKNWDSGYKAYYEAHTDYVKKQMEEEKAANDASATIAEENKKKTQEKYQHDKQVMDAYRQARKDLLSMEKSWSDDSLTKAKEAAEQQIDAFQKAGEAALTKAKLIENGAEREKAVQETSTRLVQDEVNLRADLLKKMREAYQSEFGMMFDFLKELGALTKDTLESMGRTIEKEIKRLVQDRGSEAITSREFQSLLSTYKKVQEEFYKENSTFSFGITTMHNGKPEPVPVLPKFGEMEASKNPVGDHLRDVLGTSVMGLTRDMKKMVNNFTGENGLAIESSNLKGRFSELSVVIDALNKKLADTMAVLSHQSVTKVPVKTEYLKKVTEQPMHVKGQKAPETPKAEVPFNDQMKQLDEWRAGQQEIIHEKIHKQMRRGYYPQIVAPTENKHTYIFNNHDGSAAMKNHMNQLAQLASSSVVDSFNGLNVFKA